MSVALLAKLSTVAQCTIQNHAKILGMSIVGYRVSVAHDVDSVAGMSVFEMKTAEYRLTKINFQTPLVEVLAQVFEIIRQGRFQLLEVPTGYG